MPRTIDLSCDLGEAAEERQQAIEDALWPLITSANVACGAHAGDAETMRHAVSQARRFRVRLGAHPSYPDQEYFGRRSFRLPRNELRRSLTEQIETLASIADALTHVKPHGALYNDAYRDYDLARIVVEAIAQFDPRLAVVSSADSALFRIAREKGLPTIAEAFADRRYRSDGSLVPRTDPDALLTDLDDAAEQAFLLARSGTVRSADSRTIRIVFDTICVHGDMERSVERLERIRTRLREAGFVFAPAIREKAN